LHKYDLTIGQHHLLLLRLLTCWLLLYRLLLLLAGVHREQGHTWHSLLHAHDRGRELRRHGSNSCLKARLLHVLVLLLLLLLLLPSKLVARLICLLLHCHARHSSTQLLQVGSFTRL
jgi:hypothetical protein